MNHNNLGLCVEKLDKNNAPLFGGSSKVCPTQVSIRSCRYYLAAYHYHGNAQCVVTLACRARALFTGTRCLYRVNHFVYSLSSFAYEIKNRNTQEIDGAFIKDTTVPNAAHRTVCRSVLIAAVPIGVEQPFGSSLKTRAYGGPM